MNYIWHPLIEAIQLGYDITKMRYTVNGERVSPYLEYLPVALYDPESLIPAKKRLAQVDVNPYNRFTEIFSHISRCGYSHPNDAELCDLITHMLADVDRICGMCKRDFQIMLLMRDMDAGCFGNTQTMALFTVFEKRALAEALIMLYRTCNSVRCLDSLFTMIMTDFKLMIRDDRELVFYNPYAYDSEAEKKLLAIINIFLPIDYPYVIHWQKTYGVIGHDESMTLEGFVL